MIAKLVHANEIHLYKGEMTLSSLTSHCLKAFKTLGTKLQVNLEFSYIDEEGDKINVSCPEDLEVLSENSSSSKLKKLYVEAVEDDFEVLNPEDIQIQPQETKIEKAQFIIPRSSNKNKTNKLSSFGREAIIRKQVKKFYEELTANAVKRVEEEDRLLEKNEVKTYLSDLAGVCACDLLQEQEKSLKLEASYEQIKKSSTKTKQAGVQGEELTEAKIERLVEEKLAQLMPGLIKKAVRAAEWKIKIEGCSNQSPKRLKKNSQRSQSLRMI